MCRWLERLPVVSIPLRELFLFGLSGLGGTNIIWFEFQFPYGNYFCLDWVRVAGGLAGILFQFPYGNYFCLDGLIGGGAIFYEQEVSIPLRELFLFGRLMSGGLELPHHFRFNSLTGIIFVWTAVVNGFICHPNEDVSIPLRELFLFGRRRMRKSVTSHDQFQFPYGNYFCLD